MQQCCTCSSLRSVEAAQVRTMQELRAQEEARWDAERRHQAEVVRSGELESAVRRAEEELASRVESAELREAKASADAQKATKAHLDTGGRKTTEVSERHCSNAFLPM